MNLATHLKAARARLGLSQSQAAKAWDVPLKSLQRWEQAESSMPRGEIILRLTPILFLGANKLSPSSSSTKPAAASKRKRSKPTRT
ncbi:MAG: helix-turn-helix domain-containing protein [Verrucomicrobia bacterium]|nr:helix-turn-helix domain-containing protein [Verrucomicrobiota bacterium]